VGRFDRYSDANTTVVMSDYEIRRQAFAAVATNGDRVIKHLV
jgi:hypothetical protein